MRIAGYLVAVSLLLGVGLPLTMGEEPSSSETTPKKEAVRQFTVQCHFVGEGMHDLTSPKLIVREGEKKSAGDTKQKSFTIGNKTDKTHTPTRRELTEGYLLEATVVGNGDSEAIVDLSFEMSAVVAGSTKNGGVCWIAKKYRVIECVTVGKQFVAKFGDFDLEIVVDAVP